jgi:ABC-type branched-subunit amino acid transport system ATPase component
VRCGIARTFQIVRPFADLTVIENAMVAGFRGTRDPALARARAEAALELPGMRALRERVYALFPRLRERHRQSAGTLSGGESRCLPSAAA